MANTKQSAKRADQGEQRRKHNASRRSEMRTLIKKVRKAISEANAETAATAFNAAQSIIDRYARKGLVPKNAASRYKSRLCRQIKALAA
ncbi:MAG: 30S ribosomal protein S20 [Gammaproteobacteria bacterium]